MIYKVGLLGASGKMGLEIASLLAHGFDRLELADAVTQTARLKSIEGVDVRTLSDPPREPVHIWIDFSRPEAGMKLLSEWEGRVVIGTTGHSENQLSQIRAYAERFPVLLAPNMSPGMSRMRKALASLSPHPAYVCDVLVSEAHHHQKKDAPSGTAKSLVHLLEKAGYRDIQVQSARLGGEPGTHLVKLSAEEEEIEISHRVFDRRVFARGALQAALFLLKQDEPRLYSIDEVFS